MSRSMTKIDTWCDLKEVTVPGLPIQIKSEILGKIDANVGLGRNGVVGVLDLQLVAVDGDIGSFEVFQATLQDMNVSTAFLSDTD